MIYWEDYIETKRQKLRNFFTKRERRSKLARNPVTLQSLISKYHQLHFLERYPTGIPKNLITNVAHNQSGKL